MCLTQMVNTNVRLQVSFVGATEEQAREAAQKKGYADKVAVVKTSFKANTKVCHNLFAIVDVCNDTQISQACNIKAVYTSCCWPYFMATACLYPLEYIAAEQQLLCRLWLRRSQMEWPR